MEFIAGFMLAWFLLGCFGFAGVARDWYYEEWFRWLLILPAVPVLWVWLQLRDLFR